MHRSSFFPASAALLLAATAACRQPADASDPGDPGDVIGQKAHARKVADEDVVARIGDRVITIEDLQEQINRENAYTRMRYSSPEKRKEYLENVVRIEILAMEARKRGFGNDPDIIRMMKQQLVARLIQKDFEPQHDPSQIPEPEVKAYWESHKDTFNEPEQVDATHILLADEEQAKKVAAMVRRLGKQDEEGYQNLVRMYSIDTPSKMRGGELGFFDRNATRLGKDVIAAAFALTEPGAIGGPVKDDKGFHILRFLQRKAPVIRTYEQAAPMVRTVMFKQIRNDALKAWLADLRAKIQVTVSDKNLDKVHIDTSNSPGAQDPPLLKYAPQVFPGMADQADK